VTGYNFVAWVACFGQLVLVGLALASTARRSLGQLLALLSASLFLWNFATLAAGNSRWFGWHLLDLAVSPTTPPLALHLVLTLVGRARAARHWIVAAYLAFASLSAASLAGFVSGTARSWVLGSSWTLVYALLSTPLFAVVLVVLARHCATAIHREEQLRARLLIAAFASGGGLMLTELINDYLRWLPGLGALGALFFSSLLSLVVARYGLLGGERNSAYLRYALPLACIGLGGFALLERLLHPHLGLQAVAAVVVVLALLAAMREFASELMKRREREQRLLFLGRVSAQLAHDLRNPLAALKGALDYVRDDVSEQDRKRFFELMDDQVTRMQAVLEGYGRIGRLELEPQLLSLNELLAETIEAQALAHAHVTLQFAPAPRLPACSADPKLLTLAMENLIRNASQACHAGGTIVVRTTPGAATSTILIQVEDDGDGIAASDKEQVFDEFFSTRTFGTGLGLHFVRRVARAHGGEVLLESRIGVGTIVSLCLPASSPRLEPA
jgi:two-component system sensor histidine kinase HydH